MQDLYGAGSWRSCRELRQGRGGSRGKDGIVIGDFSWNGIHGGGSDNRYRILGGDEPDRGIVRGVSMMLEIVGANVVVG